MKKIVCVLAILAAAASTAALAKDLKQDNKATMPAVAATQMTDAEMDRVTGGTSQAHWGSDC
jgi:mono/diheme cytochrome c family protein